MTVQHLTDPERDRLDDKPLLCPRFRSCREAKTQQLVDSPLIGVTRTPHFLLHKRGHIVVNGQSCSHIMMLPKKAS
jgi:hypothetical protein